MDVSFIIYLNPVAKGRPKFARRGSFVTAYTPGKTKIAEKLVQDLAMQYKPVVPFTKQASVSLIFFMPIVSSMIKKDKEAAHLEILPHVKKPDLDNLEKLVLDALTGSKKNVNCVFFRDDSIIYRVVKTKMYSTHPRIEIEIKGE